MAATSVATTVPVERQQGLAKVLQTEFRKCNMDGCDNFAKQNNDFCRRHFSYHTGLDIEQDRMKMKKWHERTHLKQQCAKEGCLNPCKVGKIFPGTYSEKCGIHCDRVTSFRRHRSYRGFRKHDYR